MLPDFERPDRIGEFYGNRKRRIFAELLTDWTLRAVLVGMLPRGRTLGSFLGPGRCPRTHCHALQTWRE